MRPVTKTFEENVKDFLDGAYAHIDVDYGDKKSVQKSNNGIKKYRKAAMRIGTNYPDRVDEFAELLKHQNIEIAYRAAISMFEFMDPNDDQTKLGFNLLFDVLYKADNATRMGLNWWLDQYFGEHPEHKQFDERDNNG